MKQFCCGDVVPGCSAVFCGSTEEQILQDVARHARQDHGLMHVPESMVAKVRSLIRPVPVGAAVV